jgi:serine/threonine protein kinase
MLSGSYQDDSYLWDVTSLCQTKPEFARRLLALIERYNRLGQMPAAHYTRIRQKIEEIMPPQDRPAAAAATAAASTITSTVNAAPPVKARRLPPEATTTAPLPTNASATPATPATPAAPAGKLRAARTTGAARTAPPPPEQPRSLFEKPKAAKPRTDDPPFDKPSAAKEPASATAHPPSRADLIIEPGAVLKDRYELDTLLGCGGMAAVYKALDRYRANLNLADCFVALKIVAPHSAAHTDGTALEREFHNAQQLSHPNAVNVFEIGQEGGATFYTMELLEGEKLDDLEARIGGPLPRAQALSIIRDVGAAIEHAHSRGVLHADLKPQNVFITFGGQVRVLDFGGLSLPSGGPWIGEPGSDGNERYRTATPAYGSCEQLEGKQVDARDDIYALGCIAYELLTGRHPFDGLTALQARAQHLRPQRPVALSGSSWRALRRALAWDRAQRPHEIGPWLEQLGVAHAAPRLPPTYELRSHPARSGWGGWTALAAAVLACVVGYVVSTQAPARAGWSQLLSTVQSSLSQASEQIQQRLSGPNAQPATDTPSVADMPSRVAVAAAAPASTSRSRHRDDTAAQLAELAATAPREPADAAPAAARSALPTSIGRREIVVADNSDNDTAGTNLHQAVAFSASSYHVDDGSPAARVVVRRHGGSQNELRFVWWTVDDTAKADVDYAPLGRRTEYIPSGQDQVTIYVPIISNPLRHETATFYVALGDPHGDNDTSSARASVTIERGG